MMSSNLTLVVFTICVQVAIGLILVNALRQWNFIGSNANVTVSKSEWILALVFLGVGVFASVFHLGHPMGALRTLSNLGMSWLSREILMLIILGTLILISLIGIYKGKASKGIITITGIAGLVTLFVMGQTYTPTSMPAINNYLPMTFFGISAVILGAGFASYFSPLEQQKSLAVLMGTGLAIGLLFHLVIPSVWISSGTIAKLTGELYLDSPLHWIHIFGLLASLLVLVIKRHIPTWLPIFVIVVEICGRILFHTIIVSEASHIGGIY